MSLFFCSAILAGAFSGLLAFAIANMSGVGGLGAWRCTLLWTFPDFIPAADPFHPYSTSTLVTLNINVKDIIL